MKVLLLPLLLLALSSPLSARGPPSFGWTSPDFCHGLDCPVYQTYFEDNSTGVEYRAYQPAVSARTKIYGISYEDAVNQGFNLLFDYITGDNNQGIDIEMTTPVDTQIIFSQGPFCQTEFIVSFYCPYLYQDPSNPPPKPTNPAVYIETIPAQKRAVYGLPGYLEKWTAWIQPSTFLFDYLDDQGVNYNANYECTNVYDSPFRPVKRHNEVWVTLE